MNLEAEKNNLIVLRASEEMISLIKNNEFDKIDAITISDFIEKVEKIVDPELKKLLGEKAEQVKEIFIDNRTKLDNESLNRAVDALEAIRFNIAVIDVKRNANEQAAKTKESLEAREEQYREDYKGKLNEEFLRTLKNKRGERVYSDEAIAGISTYAELEDLVNSIKNLGQTNETKEQDKKIEEAELDTISEVKPEITIDDDEVKKIAEEGFDNKKVEDEIKETEDFVEEIIEKEETKTEIEEIIVDIDELNNEYKEVEREIIGYIQANNAKLNSLKLHKERLEEEKQNITETEENKEEIRKEYDRQIAETVKEIRNIISPSFEEQQRIRKEKDNLYRLATKKIQKIEAIISDLKQENRRLEFEHSEMIHNGISDYTRWNHITNKINDNTYKIRLLNEMIEKYKGLKEELMKTEKVIKMTPEEPVIDVEQKETDEEEFNPKEPEDFKPSSFDDAINILKETLDKDMSPEEIKSILLKIETLVVEKYKFDQVNFEKNLSNAKTVEEKLDLISKREEELLVYIKLLSHPTKEIDDILEGSRNKIKNIVANSYNSAKANGEYCWKEFRKVKESREYIYASFNNDKTWIEQFTTLMDNMEGIIKNPEQKQYEDWRNGINLFVEERGLDAEKMLPYVNARAKVVNPNVSVDKEFNINGLNLKNEKNNDKENKKRRKVTDVKKAKGFFQRHPKLKVIAIGLGILLGSQLGLAGLMMVNSALWSVLGGQGAICGMLHAINLGLSKIVGAGLFQFTNAGTYTFLGKPGALALYNSAGAKLTAAAAALGGGLAVAKKIKNKNEKKTNWLKEKLKNIKWFKKDKNEELEENEQEEKNEVEEKTQEEPEKTTKEELEEMKKQAEAIKKQQEEELKKKTIEQLEQTGLSREDAERAILNPEDEEHKIRM